MRVLNGELMQIPFAYGTIGQDPPPAAQVTTANFEVVEPATQPVCPDFADPAGVGLEDILAVAGNWDKTSSDPNWNQISDYDLDKDGDIDVVDVMLVAAQWGNSC